MNTTLRRNSNSTSQRRLSSIMWVTVLLTVSFPLIAVSDKSPTIPPTPRKPVFETYHGVKVQDDYEWLENWDDPAVRAWSDAQSAYARAFLDALLGRRQIRDRLAALRSDTSVSFFAPDATGALPFPEASFDAITCIDAINHFRLLLRPGRRRLPELKLAQRIRRIILR